MSDSNLSRCPYTLKPIGEIAETSREHVILDALGGPDGYSVTADRTVNNKLGETVDAAFLSDSIVEMLRSKVGVKSRNGVASWNMKGETVDGNRPVEMSIPHKGPADVYHVKPVEKSADGKSFQIIASAPQSNKLLEEIRKNLAKKGIGISEVKTTQSPSQQIQGRLKIDFTVMRAGLMKIAYLACCHYFGDRFLDDPLNPEWQKAIRAQTAEDAANIKLHGQCFDAATASTKALLPSLAEHEHCIAIVKFNQRGPFVAVRLFGSEILTTIIHASETDDFGLAETDGVLLICDSLTGEIRREPWSNHVLRLSGITPPATSV